ncbi:hypothetical protein MD484_g1764, partial [Candolleomyces efflorescens]
MHVPCMQSGTSKTPRKVDPSRIKAAASSSSLKVNEAGPVTKPASKAKSVAQSAEDEDEEGGSVADSLADSVMGAAGGRISRTAKDRQEYFKNQSDCHAFGPHRAICSRCKKIVNLTRKQTYAVGPWERHRAKCDQELARYGSIIDLHFSPPSIDWPAISYVSDSPLPHNAEEIVNATAQEVFPEQPVRRNASERRAFLEADKFVEIAEEDRVKCANCQKFVALKKGQPYDLAKWKQHRDKCATQSDRVLAAERKLTIVNDPLVKTFDSTSVECATCGAKVVSSSGKEYDLGAWEEHKALCRSKIETSSGANSIPFPTESSSAKPPSTASTEVTVVAPEPVLGNQTSADQHSKKRPRDDNAGNPDEDERPSNRARTETQDSPGVMGWIMLPFKSFARGFRESLKNSDRS